MMKKQVLHYLRQQAEPRVSGERRGRRRNTALLLLAGVIFAGFCSAQTVRAGEPVISKGVCVEGIDLGGQTRSQAMETIEEEASRMKEALLTMTIGDSTVTATFEQMGAVWENREIVDEIVTLGTTGTIFQRYKDQKDLEHQNKEYSLSFVMNEDKARTFIQGCSIYNTEPVDGSVYMSDEGIPAVDGGTDGITLRVDDSVEIVREVIENWEGGDAQAELAVDRESPVISKDRLILSDTLGIATTDYSASSYERAINIENGCSKISGTLLFPGDEFSVTAAVAPFTAENGYQQAPTYEENRVVDSYGGGICQVSTTLYNAVLKAELEVTARSNHTMIVTYVDPSKDAAIAEGVMDMCFVNNQESPVYIYGYTYGGTITFQIFGHDTRPSNRRIEFVSNVTSTTEPSGFKMYANPNQNIGYMNQTQSPHTGYTAELWKNIYIDEELVDSYQVNSSTYEAVSTAYDIGVASSNAQLTQAMYAAIGNNDLNQVQAIISGAYSTPQTEVPAVSQIPEELQQVDPNTGEIIFLDPPE